MRVWTRWLLLAVCATVSGSGCRSNCCKNHAAAPPVPAGTYVPGGPAPLIGPPIGTTPTAPAPSSEILMPAAPAAPSAPTPSLPSTSGFPSVTAPNLSQSAYLALPPNFAPLNPPAATSPAAPKPTIRLLAPETAASAPEVGNASPPPPAAAPTLPAGIRDFAPALGDRVANGRKPLLDGLDWLKANGYRGALQLRRPNEADAADRKQFEQRGLKFASIAIAPETLTRATIDEFAQVVRDSATQPLFVYDSTGTLTGTLWYLYFRQVERLSDDAARVRAGRLGLRDPSDADSRALWDAAQRVLAPGI